MLVKFNKLQVQHFFNLPKCYDSSKRVKDWREGKGYQHKGNEYSGGEMNLGPKGTKME